MTIRKASVSLLAILVFCLNGLARKRPAVPVAQLLHNGDIVFQYIPCGALCESIIATTPCAPGHPFNHCGIVARAGDSVFILEAIGKDVHSTPLSVFLKRDTAARLFAGRPLKRSGIDADAVLRRAAGLAGRPYDDAFLPGDSALYCSELVYACYMQKGKPAFTLEPMTFKSPRSGETFPAWAAYYSALGLPVPEGLPGINPCAIARSPAIRLMVFRKDALQGAALIQ